MSDDEKFIGPITGRKYTRKQWELIQRGRELNARELTDEEKTEAEEWEASLPLHTPLPTGKQKFVVLIPPGDLPSDDRST